MHVRDEASHSVHSMWKVNGPNLLMVNPAVVRMNRALRTRRSTLNKCARTAMLASTIIHTECKSPCIKSQSSHSVSYQKQPPKTPCTPASDVIQTHVRMKMLPVPKTLHILARTKWYSCLIIHRPAINLFLPANPVFLANEYHCPS